MRLVSLTELKISLEITSVTEHDLLLGQILDRVSSRIQDYLNRLLEKEERTQYFESGRRYYYLPAFPIDLAQTLTVTYDGTVQTLNTQYYVRAGEGLIEFHKDHVPTYCDPQEIEITWTGGYAETGTNDSLRLDVPDVIVDAATRQCLYNFRRRKDIGLSSISMPDGSLSKLPNATSLLPEVRDMLRPLRRPAGEY